MSAFKTDGDYTVATRVRSWRKSFPIPGDNTSFIVEEDVEINFSSFSPLALNTAHATFTDAYLVSESPLEDIGGGVARYTRTYAQVPAARDEFETYATTFPGLLGATYPPYSQYWVTDNSGGRDPFTEAANSRLRYEYFLCATGETYETPGEIPVLLKQEFTMVANEDAVITYLLPAGTFWSDSVPTKEAWLDLKAGGGGLGTGAQDGEFIAEDSRIERFLGNIYVRITRYVKAK